MYIRSETDDALTPTDDPLCPPDYPACAPSLSAGPALANVNAEGAPTTSIVTPTTASNSAIPRPAPAIAQPQSALAARIQHLGQRNFVGIVVVAVFVFVGLVLWLSFGKWPRAGVRRVRERFKRGDELAQSGGGGAPGGSPAGEERSGHRPGSARQPPASVSYPQSSYDSEKHDVDQREGETSTPCSPRSLEMEVESLGKHAREVPRKKVPRVHFA